MTRILICHTGVTCRFSCSYFTIFLHYLAHCGSYFNLGHHSLQYGKKRSKEKYGAALKSFRLIEGQSDNCRESDEHWQPWR